MKNKERVSCEVFCEELSLLWHSEDEMRLCLVEPVCLYQRNIHERQKGHDFMSKVSFYETDLLLLS